MSTAIHLAAGAIIPQLKSAERAGNALVLETAALSVTLIEGSISANLRAVQGQTAISEVAEAHRLAAQARFHLVRAHRRLAEEADKIGLDWTMFGDEADTPPTEPQKRQTQTNLAKAE